MRTGKKALCLLLALALLMGCALPVGAAATRFDDVKSGDWFFDAVTWVTERGYFSGTSATTFAPGASMSRGMFVTVLANREDMDPGLYQNSRYRDVEKGAWYAAPVEWASSWGIVSGTGSTYYDENTPARPDLFSPSAPITRQDMAVILCKYAGKLGGEVDLPGDLNAFSDQGQIAPYAREAMEWATAAGVLKGDNGRLRPRDTLTRAEAAAVFSNLEGVLPASRLPESPVVPGLEETYTFDGTRHTYRLPAVSIPGVDTSALNQAIVADSPIEDVRESAANGYSSVCAGIDYSYSVYGNILSILVISPTMWGGTASYVPYVVDMSTGRLLENEEILETAGYSQADYSQAARRALERCFDAYAATFASSSATPDSIIRQARANTVSAGNYRLENTPLYLDANGGLRMVGRVYLIAGPDSSSMPLQLSR